MRYSYDARKKAAARETALPASLPTQNTDMLRAGIMQHDAADAHRVDLPEAMRTRMEGTFGSSPSDAREQGGPVRGGFLTGRVPEAQTEHVTNAQQGPYAGPVTGAISAAAPSAATAGPIQASRKGGDQQQPAGRAANAHLEEPLQPGQLDIGQMDFGNKAYRKDRDYQAILGQMQAFNGIDQTDRQGRNQAQITLMRSAMSYIEKHSGGKTAKHKGRTAHLEKLLYDLSMMNGTAERADANLGKLRTASAASGASEELKQGANASFDQLQGVYGADSQYSPTMQMITAGVLADQNASGASDPIYTPQQTRSAASSIFHPGSPGYSGGHNYTVVSRTAKSQNDAMGTMLHELTHVANGEDYQNAGLMSIENNASDDEIRERTNERVRSTEQIFDALGTAKLRNINPDERSLKHFVTDKLSYSVENKLPQYNAMERSGNLKPLIQSGLQNRGLDEETSRSAGQYNANSRTINYLLGEGDKPQFRDEFNGPMENFQNTLTDEERTDLTRIRDMSGKQTQVDELLGAEQQDPAKRQADERRKQSVRKLMNAKEKSEGGRPREFVDMELHGSNALVEHDSIMNQLLLQYENAGLSSGQSDRDSLFYRRLRNAALKAHVQRQIAKLSR